MVDGSSERSGRALNVPLSAVASTSTHSGIAARRGRFGRRLDAQLGLGGLRDLDHVARAHLVRRNVHALAVHQDAVVAHDLARFGARGAEAHAIAHAVEPAFEHLQQRFAGDALAGRRLEVVAAELPLEHAVDAAHLLLLAQLHAVARKPRVLLAVLAGRIVAALDGAFVGEALLALQEELLAFPAALAALASRFLATVVSP